MGKTNDESAETWGTVGHLSDAEQKAFEELKAELIEQKLNNYTEEKCMLRFLRARKFSVKKAMHMIQENSKWREQFIDHEFRVNDFPSLLQFIDVGLVKVGGRDKCNRPVVYVKPCVFFPSQIESDEELVLLFVYYMDSLLRIAETEGREDFTVICDMHAWSFKNFSLPVMKIMINLLQNYYPERLGRVYVVNSPMVFSAAWSMVKPLLDERTRIKIHILGKDKKAVLESIAEDVVEERFGGTHGEYPNRDEIMLPLFNKAESQESESQPDDDSHADSEPPLGSATGAKEEKRKRHSLPRRFFERVRRLKGEKREQVPETIEEHSSMDAPPSPTSPNSRFSFSRKSNAEKRVQDLLSQMHVMTSKIENLEKELDVAKASKHVIHVPPHLVYISIALLLLVQFINLFRSSSDI